MDESVTDEELRALITKKAEEHNLPPELLLSIYESEREVVNMDRRGSILQDVSSLIKKEVEES